MNIEEALAYKLRRRNFPPGIYNPRRLLEKAVKPRSGQNVPKFFQPSSSSGNLNENAFEFCSNL